MFGALVSLVSGLVSVVVVGYRIRRPTVRSYAYIAFVSLLQVALILLFAYSATPPATK